MADISHRLIVDALFCLFALFPIYEILRASLRLCLLPTGLYNIWDIFLELLSFCIYFPVLLFGNPFHIAIWKGTNELKIVLFKVFKPTWEIKYAQTCSKFCKHFYFHVCWRNNLPFLLYTFLCHSFSYIFFDLLCTFLILSKPHIVPHSKLRPQLLTSHLGWFFFNLAGPLDSDWGVWTCWQLTDITRALTLFNDESMGEKTLVLKILKNLLSTTACKINSEIYNNLCWPPCP